MVRLTGFRKFDGDMVYLFSLSKCFGYEFTAFDWISIIIIVILAADEEKGAHHTNLFGAMVRDRNEFAFELRLMCHT